MLYDNLFYLCLILKLNLSNVLQIFYFILFYFIKIFRGKISKDSIKLTNKESYVMPKIQSQTSNHFEVLEKIPKPSTPSSSNHVYQSKEVRQLIQILEADHMSVFKTFDLQIFFFIKISFFISNDI